MWYNAEKRVKNRMTMMSVKCPHCGSENVSKAGKANEVQRYRCNNKECSHTIFQTEYKYNACKPDVKSKILVMAMNGSGVRDTARVLNICTDTVIDVIKKRSLERTSQYQIHKRA
jgi:transposase-like protein